MSRSPSKYPGVWVDGLAVLLSIITLNLGRGSVVCRNSNCRHYILETDLKESTKGRWPGCEDTHEYLVICLNLSPQLICTCWTLKSVTVKRLFYIRRLFFFFHLFLFTVLFLVPGTRLPFGLSVWDPLHAFVNKLQADIQPAAEQKLSSPSRPSFIPLCDGSWWMSGVFSPLYGRQLDCAHVLLNICNITRRIWARGGIML